MQQTNNGSTRFCAFCGRGEESCAVLFPALDRKTYICDECVDVCADFLDENFINATEEPHDELTFETLPRPVDIKANETSPKITVIAYIAKILQLVGIFFIFLFTKAYIMP